MKTSDKKDNVISQQEGQGELSSKKLSIPEHRFYLMSLESLF